MKITIDTDLNIGDFLYYVDGKEKTIYKPCTVCDNKRKVEFTQSNETFTLDCPKCTGRATKGDTKNFIAVKAYSVHEKTINDFVVEKDRQDTNKIRVFASGVLIDTLFEKRSYASGGTQHYRTKEEAETAMRELNKIEKMKEREFLEGASHVTNTTTSER